MLCDNLERGDGVWGWEEGSRVRGHMYTYGQSMLLYGRNQHDIEKQLSSNLKKTVWFFAKNVHSVCVYEIQKIGAGEVVVQRCWWCGKGTEPGVTEQEMLSFLPLYPLHCIQRKIMCIGSSHFIIRSFSKDQFCSYFIYWKKWNRYLILWKVNHL